VAVGIDNPLNFGPADPADDDGRTGQVNAPHVP
jgi:hypothetical protein